MNARSAVTACLVLIGAALAADEPPLAPSPPPVEVVIVVGAPGSSEFGELFRQWAERWQAAARRAGAECTVIGLDGPAEALEGDVAEKRRARDPEIADATERVPPTQEARENVPATQGATERVPPSGQHKKEHGPPEGQDGTKRVPPSGPVPLPEQASSARQGPADRQVLQQRLARARSPASEPLWLILLGHGTFDGKTPRYNLRGPDITPAELAAWLKPLDRPVAVLNCTSASAPFLPALSGPRRVVITATRSGFEYNFARLGGFLAEAIQDPAADLDKDDQVSLLEAFLKASAALREFYAQDGRLMTEHALLDDNGDGLGTPADWFQGLAAVKVAKEGATPDGAVARQWILLRSPQEERLGPELRARRDALEQQLSALKAQKAKLSEEEYLARIEPVLVALAELYEQAEGDPPPVERPAREDSHGSSSGANPTSP